MIRIDRGDEPIDLVRERSRQLAVARLHGRPRRSTDFDGYDAEGVRTTLLGAQVNRCAYCELPIDEAGYPVDHFRPKTHSEDIRWAALREPPPVDHGRFFSWFDHHVGERATA